ncbi:DUF2971 domain-containing protein [Clostridium perfringens]|nr:DUF2971 domain-containing protein [Clostridium perfringens]
MYDWKAEFKDLIYNNFSDADKLKKLIQENKPEKLYKYKSMSMNMEVKDLYNLLDSIENNTIWCSSPLNFNDPYDCALFINSHSILENNIESIVPNLDYKEIEEVAADKNSYSDNIEVCVEEILMEKFKIDLGNMEGYTTVTKELLHKMYDYMKKNCNIKKGNEKNFDIDAIRSVIEIFKEDVDNIVQSEFDSIRNNLAIACLSETNDNILMWSHYANNHKGICLEYDFEEINNISTIFPVIYSNNTCDISDDILNENYNFIIQKVLTKAENWKYENEWRIVVQNKDESQIGLLIKTPKVKAIYLGCRIDEENKKTIKNLAIEKGIEVYQMKMKKDSFELEPEKVELNISNF